MTAAELREGYCVGCSTWFDDEDLVDGLCPECREVVDEEYPRDDGERW